MADKSSSSKMKQSNKYPNLDICNLYIKGLWNDCTQADLDDMFRLYGVILQSRVHGGGIGFVRFEKPHEATLALSLNGTKPNIKCVNPLVINYANKKSKHPKSVIKNPNGEKVAMNVHENTKNVYFRGLPKNYKKEQIIILCSQFGTITSVRICKNNISFVRFLRGEDASNAVRNLHGTYLPNCKTPILAKLANSDPFEPKIEFYSILSKNKHENNKQVLNSQMYQYPQNEIGNVNNGSSSNSITGDVWASPASMASSKVYSNSLISSQTSQSPYSLGGSINTSILPLSLIDNSTNSMRSASSSSFSNANLNFSSPFQAEQQNFQSSIFCFNGCCISADNCCTQSFYPMLQSPIEYKNHFCFANGLTNPGTNTTNVFPIVGVTSYPILLDPSYLGFNLCS